MAWKQMWSGESGVGCQVRDLRRLREALVLGYAHRQTLRSRNHWQAQHVGLRRGSQGYCGCQFLPLLRVSEHAALRQVCCPRLTS